jgi:DNA-binding PucR family transcriptional regulator
VWRYRKPQPRPSQPRGLAGPGHPVIDQRQHGPGLLQQYELTRVWVTEILGALADDDGPHATLRHTLHVFLQENGGFKATAERLTLHKNTVQYRIRKAESSLGHPVAENRLHVELALLATQWLGAAVLRQPGTRRS